MRRRSMAPLTGMVVRRRGIRGCLARRAVEDGFAEAVEHPFQPGLALLRGGDPVVES